MGFWNVYPGTPGQGDRLYAVMFATRLSLKSGKGIEPYNLLGVRLALHLRAGFTADRGTIPI